MPGAVVKVKLIIWPCPQGSPHNKYYPHLYSLVVCILNNFILVTPADSCLVLRVRPAGKEALFGGQTLLSVVSAIRD